MTRLTFLLIFMSLVVLAGCGGGGGGEDAATLLTIVNQCSVQGQPVSCTTPGSQTVTTITPVVVVTFKEPMNRTSVQRFVEVIVQNLTDNVAIKNTVDGLVADGLVQIEWNSDSTQLTVRVLAVARQLEDGKSYQVTASVGGLGCAQTADGDQVCTGSLGPFAFRIDLP